MATNVTKIRSNEIEDIFSYRDDYNQEQIIRFPKNMQMTEEEVQEWLEG